LNVVALLDALEFAADKHRNQKRKDAERSPYVNHLIAVTRILAAEGGVDDEAALLAAVLHDTVEDTPTTFEELTARFGATVSELVREMTDDKALEKAVRKQHQIDHAPGLSPLGKQLKIADKIANSKRQGEYQKFIIKLRAEAIIDWKNDEIKKAYEVGLKEEEAAAAAANREPGTGVR